MIALFQKLVELKSVLTRAWPSSVVAEPAAGQKLIELFAPVPLDYKATPWWLALKLVAFLTMTVMTGRSATLTLRSACLCARPLSVQRAPPVLPRTTVKYAFVTLPLLGTVTLFVKTVSKDSRFAFLS